MKNTSRSKRIPLADRAGLMFAASAALIVYLSTSTIVNAAEPKNLIQYMADGVLISREDQSLAIKVADEFEFVGRHPFAIRDVAAGERFIFVQAEDHRVAKLFMVQFEGFLPGVNDFYRYVNVPLRCRSWCANIKHFAQPG